MSFLLMNLQETLILKTLMSYLNLFLSLRAKFKQTFVIVTHNAELAGMSDRKLIITDGRIDY